LPNGLATSSEVAFRRGTRVDYGATRPGEESEARRSYLQHLASFPSPRRHSAHVLLFFRDVWKLRNRVLASHHAEALVRTDRHESDASRLLALPGRLPDPAT